MSDKHYVIVPEYAVSPYSAKGYQRSGESAETHLGSAWLKLPESDRRDLVVLEIDADQHEQLQQNARRFRVHLEGSHFTREAIAREYELLDADEPESFVAEVGIDRATMVSTDELFVTAQEAVAWAIPQVRDAITEHQDAIVRLESWLRRYT